MNMKTESMDMAKTTTMTVRIAPELNEKLDALARDTKRTKAFLASEAIAAYVDRNAWQIAHIKAGLAEAESGAPSIPHDDIERWMDSWGTDHELPPPEPKA
jgi:predicted transcriptional regulator